MLDCHLMFADLQSEDWFPRHKLHIFDTKIQNMYTSVQKFGVSNFFLKEMLFIQKRCIQLIKSESKGNNNVTKDFYFK